MSNNPTNDPGNVPQNPYSTPAQNPYGSAPQDPYAAAPQDPYAQQVEAGGGAAAYRAQQPGERAKGAGQPPPQQQHRPALQGAHGGEGRDATKGAAGLKAPGRQVRHPPILTPLPPGLSDNPTQTDGCPPASLRRR